MKTKRVSPRSRDQFPEKKKGADHEANRLDARYQARVAPKFLMAVNDYCADNNVTKKMVTEEAIVMYLASKGVEVA